ncbi:MAG TPA: hypothetical protein VF444_01525 [Pseudonocardiaceae bacterium]
MGFFDILLGRTKPVQPNLDVLFAIPGAAFTLQAARDLVPTGAGAVCFRAAEGAAAHQTERDIRDLLNLDPGVTISVSKDEYGYTWVVCRQAEGEVDLPTLMTDLHGVNSTLVENGFGPFLLCTVIGFTGEHDGKRQRLGLIYLYKRGTVYPFAPIGPQQRDTDLELQVRADITGDVPVESDLSRWFPIWGSPVP